MSELTHERRMEIQSVLQELSDYWHEYPELRLGQIIVNLTPRHHEDPFHVQDSYYLAVLEVANSVVLHFHLNQKAVNNCIVRLVFSRIWNEF